MLENKLFEALLDVIPFGAYAVDVNTYEVIYANKSIRENMYAPQETYCWEKIYGQNQICSWCTIHKLQHGNVKLDHEKYNHEFFDEIDDKWISSYDELMAWPDGRDVKYSILVDTTNQKSLQGAMLQSHAKLAVKSKFIKKTNKQLQITKLNLQKTVRELNQAKEKAEQEAELKSKELLVKVQTQQQMQQLIQELECSKIELQRLASTDPMTKLYNRRHFANVSGHILGLAKREHSDLSIIMLDIDYFKQFNDNYGHKVGDEVIISLASTLQAFSRESDVLCRFGGEEFIVLLPETDLDGAIVIAEKMRIFIENSVVEINSNDTDSQQLKVTVSIGVAIIDIKQDSSIEASIQRADKALYRAKKTGRNKVSS
ncbi:MAG: GGDEF domain-containing protein [Pseudomonadota bacterium]